MPRRLEIFSLTFVAISFLLRRLIKKSISRWPQLIEVDSLIFLVLNLLRFSRVNQRVVFEVIVLKWYYVAGH
jgi:hypothetical protein